MDVKHAFGYGAALLAILLVGFCWLRAHDAWKDATAENRILAQTAAEKDRQIKAAGERERSQNAELEKAKARPATIQTVTKYLPAPLPEGSQVSVQSDASGKPAVVLSGDAQTNLNWLRDQEIACKECQTSLGARNEQYTLAQDKIKAIESERDNWEKAAKAHSGFWKGLKNDAIKIGIGAAAGYALGKR